MPDINLDKVHLDWCMDILRRMQSTLQDRSTPDPEKLQIMEWLVKQALKSERED